jgi:hypothetical protein
MEKQTVKQSISRYPSPGPLSVGGEGESKEVRFIYIPYLLLLK